MCIRDSLGIASLSLGFGGEDRSGTYHSAYDDPWFEEHFGDKDELYGKALAQTCLLYTSVAAMGGTSAVAPLYAALVARLNQALPQPCGHMNPKLYALAMKEGQDIFRVIPEGTNGAYTASTGWNACAGLGSVDGTKLLNALKSQG